MLVLFHSEQFLTACPCFPRATRTLHLLQPLPWDLGAEGGLKGASRKSHPAALEPLPPSLSAAPAPPPQTGKCRTLSNFRFRQGKNKGAL